MNNLRDGNRLARTSPTVVRPRREGARVRDAVDDVDGLVVGEAQRIGGVLLRVRFEGSADGDGSF